MSELKEEGDVGAWLDLEAPGWKQAYHGAKYTRAYMRVVPYAAQSPTYELDGVVVEAYTPEELVERIRLMERILAVVCGREGSVPVEGTVAGVALGEVKPPLKGYEGRFDPTLVTLSSSTKEMAQVQGFTGEACPTCGSMRTVRNGKCVLCTECFASGECG